MAKTPWLLRLKPRWFRWALTFYPPLWINRIRPIHISDDFCYIKVRIRRSFLNRNINGTIFGGTISAAFDPWWGLIYWYHLHHRNIITQVWVKSLAVQYRKPGDRDLFIEFRLEADELDAVIHQLRQEGKVIKMTEAIAVNRLGEVCAEAQIEIYLKKLASNQDYPPLND
jgi:acyl-coenzyme A thioesterase PaaI-like protein